MVFVEYAKKLQQKLLVSDDSDNSSTTMLSKWTSCIKRCVQKVQVSNNFDESEMSSLDESFYNGP